MNRSMCLLIFALLVACSDSNSLKPQEFQERIKSTPDAFVIDVRTTEETHSSGIIEGAIVSDFNAGEFEKSISSLDKSKTYFLYCASGVRSGKAANHLKEQGVENVFVLEGGTKAWVKEGLQLVPQ